MTFAQLAIVCAVALLGPLLAVQRLAHVPVVIGELLVGVALGATGFGVLDSTNATFGFLAQVGFALVMFVAGSQVPIRDPALREGALRGVARAVGIAVLSIPAHWRSRTSSAPATPRCMPCFSRRHRRR